MTTGSGALRDVVADASALINLFASGREEDLLRGAGRRLLLADVTADEACFTLGPPDADGNDTRVPIDLAGLERAGLATVRPLPAESSRHLVAAAEQLSDRDARPVALAVGLGVALWSDDAKQVRVARSLLPEIEIVSTLSIVKLAVDSLSLTRAEISTMAEQIRTRGRFLPPRRDPNADWFRQALEGKST